MCQHLPGSRLHGAEKGQEIAKEIGVLVDSKRLEMGVLRGVAVSQLNFEGDSGMLRVFRPSLVQSFLGCCLVTPWLPLPHLDPCEP